MTLVTLSHGYVLGPILALILGTLARMVSTSFSIAPTDSVTSPRVDSKSTARTRLASVDSRQSSDSNPWYAPRVCWNASSCEAHCCENNGWMAPSVTDIAARPPIRRDGQESASQAMRNRGPRTKYTAAAVHVVAIGTQLVELGVQEARPRQERP